MPTPLLIDLFAGSGGFTLGAYRAGFKTALAVEIDQCLGSRFGVNFPGAHLLQGDVSKIRVLETIRAADLHPDEIAGIIGGPPCQGFSDIGFRDPGDPRSRLLSHFFRWVRALRPPFFVMENVPGLLRENFAPLLYSEIARTRGYEVIGPVVVDAAGHGAATHRRRVVVVGYRRGAISPIHTQDLTGVKTAATTGDAIRDIPAPATGSRDQDGDHWAAYPDLAADSSPYATRAREAPPQGLASEELRKKVVHGRVSGVQPTAHTVAVLNRWAALPQGAIDRVSRAHRLHWERPAPTLRAGTGPDHGSYQAVRPIHPDENRVITVREAARLQGFPDWFQFHPTIWHSFRMIGNSVSPYMAEGLLSAIHSRLR
jgi:DNA (cytosine-5)-methyltransferase 1